MKMYLIFRMHLDAALLFKVKLFLAGFKIKFTSLPLPRFKTLTVSLQSHYVGVTRTHLQQLPLGGALLCSTMKRVINT